MGECTHMLTIAPPPLGNALLWEILSGPLIASAMIQQLATTYLRQIIKTVGN